MGPRIRLIVAASLLTAFDLSGATIYVSLASTNPTPPYGTWTTAATNIQDAIDAAPDGATVLVTNGVYEAGGKDIDILNWRGDLVNRTCRVVITRSIRLESVNGPTVTSIRGTKFFDEYGYVTNGIKCVFLGSNAIVTGFTFADGFGSGVRGSSPNSVLTNCIITGNLNGDRGGGAEYCTLYNCNLVGNSSRGGGPEGGYGGGAYSCTLYNCTLTSNSVSGFYSYGGGACASTLYDCTLTGNGCLTGYPRAQGGGASWCTLYNCTITANTGWAGGGVNGCTLYNCALVGNRVWGGIYNDGGGASFSTLYNCTVMGNSATCLGNPGGNGGGAVQCTLYNCTLIDNSASGSGGGALGGRLYNCTLLGNSALEDGGGVSGGTLYNCVVYYNTALNGANYSGETSETSLNYCCTMPVPTNGIGNIPGPPLFMDLAANDLRLQENSPCIDTGANLLQLDVGYTFDPIDMLGNTRFIDGDGDGRIDWDIGAYEFNSFKPPRFSPVLQLTADGCHLCLTGEPNKWLRVQRSSNLRDWTDIWSGFMEPDGVHEMNDSNSIQRVMYYRAVVP